MNEFIFLFHVLLCVAITCAAYRLSREALFAWIVLQPILANLFVLKEIALFGFNVTTCDAYAVSALLANNLMQEYFGYQEAKKAIFVSFLAMLAFISMSSLHLVYCPSAYDKAHAAYQGILVHTPRLVLASIISFVTVQQIDLRFFRFLKTRYVAMPLWRRNIAALSVSQCFDTLLFSFLGLYGLVSNLFEIFIISFVLKCTIGGLMVYASQTKYVKVP